MLLSFVLFYLFFRLLLISEMEKWNKNYDKFRLCKSFLCPLDVLAQHTARTVCLSSFRNFRIQFVVLFFLCVTNLQCDCFCCSGFRWCGLLSLSTAQNTTHKHTHTSHISLSLSTKQTLCYVTVLRSSTFFFFQLLHKIQCQNCKY